VKGFADVIGENGWMAEFGSSRRDIFPERPRAAAVAVIEPGRPVRAAEARSRSHRTERDDDLVLFIDRNLDTTVLVFADDTRDPVQLAAFVIAQIDDARVGAKSHAVLVEPLAQRPHHRVVLVVDRTHDAVQLVEARRHMREAQQVAAEFDRAMPRLKRKGRAPHEPEVGFEKVRLEVFRNPAIAKQGFRFDRETAEREYMPLGEFIRRRGLAPAITHEPRFRRGADRLVPVENFFRDAAAPVQCRNRVEQIVGAQIFAFEHAAAADHVALVRRAGTVQTAAGLVERLEDRDVAAGHVGVAYEERSGRERRNAAADEMEMAGCRRGVPEAIPGGARRKVVWVVHAESPEDNGHPDASVQTIPGRSERVLSWINGA
jgi:hypothetical protein